MTDVAGGETELPSLFEGRAEFHRALMGLMGQAERGSAQRLYLVDPDFSVWPLGDATFLTALTNFVKRPGRQVWVLAQSDASWPRQQVRFQVWRQSWGHTLKLLRPESNRLVLPRVALLERSMALNVLDADHWRGRVEREASAVSALTESISALFEDASEAFALRPLGL